MSTSSAASRTRSAVEFIFEQVRRGLELSHSLCGYLNVSTYTGFGKLFSHLTPRQFARTTLQHHHGENRRPGGARCSSMSQHFALGPTPDVVVFGAALACLVFGRCRHLGNGYDSQSTKASKNPFIASGQLQFLP